MTLNYACLTKPDVLVLIGAFHQSCFRALFNFSNDQVRKHSVFWPNSIFVTFVVLVQTLRKIKYEQATVLCILFCQNISVEHKTQRSYGKLFETLAKNRIQSSNNNVPKCFQVHVAIFKLKFSCYSL